jgi:hypothetical protein
MVETSGICIATRYRISPIYSIERSEGSARKIVDQESTRRYEEKPMGCPGRVGVATYDPIRVVIAKNDRAGRARWINAP